MTDSNTPRSTFDVARDLEIRFKGPADNSKCEVDQWAIQLDGMFFLANLILPRGAPEGARWLFGSVAAAIPGTPVSGYPAVWGYRDDTRVTAGFDGHVFSIALGDQTMLVYATKGKSPQVTYVVPLAEIIRQKEVEVPLDVRMARKRQVAELLGYDVEYTATETAWNKYRAEQTRAEEEAHRQAEVERRMAERQAKINAILARKHLTVYAAGKMVEAIWVIDGEWQMLPPRTRVILGEIRDDKFFALETFTVFKKRGSPAEKSYVAKVGIEPTVDTPVKALPAPVVTAVVLFEGAPFEVPTFAQRDDLEAHRLAGLNSGVLRGVAKMGGIDLYRVRKDGLETVESEAFTVIG